MPQKNVVLPDGRVVAVDASVARQSQLAEAGSQDLVPIAEQEIRDRRTEGFAQGAASFGEGFADMVTFGGYGALASQISPEYGHEMQLRAEERALPHLAGEVAGLFLPTGDLKAFTGPGFAEHAGKALEGFIGSRAINPLTRTEAFLAKTAGRMGEGMILGGGAEVAHANISADPLTVESFVEGATLGGLMNVGVGFMADGLGSLGPKFSRELAETSAFEKELALADRGKAVFENGRAAESYKTLESAVHALDDEAIGEWNTLHTAVKDYEDAIGDFGTFGRVRSQFNKEMGTIREDWIQGKSAQTSQREIRNSFLKQNPKPEAPPEPELEALPKEPKYTNPPPAKVLKEPKMPPKPVRPRVYPGQEADLAAYEGEVKAWQAEKQRLTSEYQSGQIEIGKAHQAEQDKIWSTYNAERKRVEAVNTAATKEYQKAQAEYQTRVKNWEKGLEDYVKTHTEFARVPKGSTPDAANLASQHLNAIEAQLRDAERQWKFGSKDTALMVLKKARQDIVDVYGTHMNVKIDVPEIPPVKRHQLPPRPTKTAFPKKLSDFARARPEDSARIMNRLAEKKDALGAPLARLMEDVGLTPAGDVAKDYTALTSQLREYGTIIDKLEAKAQQQARDKAASTGNITAWMDKAFRNGVRNAVGFKTFEKLGGGMLGAAGAGAMRTGTGALTGYFSAKVLGGDETEAEMAAVMLGAKATMGGRIKQLVARYAAPGARAIARLGPITSVASTRFMSHEHDPEPDMRQQVKNRIREVIAASQSAEDTAYSAVSGLKLIGDPSDVGFKVHQQYVRALHHLQDTAPKDPGTAMDFQGNSSWSPTWAESIAWLHRVEAVLNPLKAIARVLAGEAHPATVETLYYTSPAITGTVAEELTYNRPNIPYERAGGACRLLGIDTGIQQPGIALQIQGMYLPRSEGEPRNATEQLRGAGRPAAVDNKVAGTSVSALVSSARS